MPFQVPDNLEAFSIAGLQDLRGQAEAEYKTLVASVAPETVTDEQIERLEELQAFYRVDVPNMISGRKDRSDRLNAVIAAQSEPETPAADEAPVEPETPTEPEVVTASQGESAPRISDLAPGATNSPVPTRPRVAYSTLVAATGVPNFESGQPLPTMLDVAKAFEARSTGHNAMAKGGRGGSPVMYPVAQLIRDYPPEFSVNGDETDYPKLLNVMDETRLPGGSLIESSRLRYEETKKEHPERDALVAAQGWCAPSETDYDICLQISTDGMFDAPEVQARRGGIRHNTGLEFDTIFGDCTTHPGYFDLTEAQVAAGTTKTCLEIPCPDFTDDRLGVTGLCLTGNILAIRGYPEFTATFTRGALAALAHLVNREQIAEVVTGSTAVTLSGAPWATDGSTVSQVLSAVEMAIMDIKYRMRLSQNSTLDVVMPFWIGAQMRADWIRRNGGNYAEMLTLSDEAINAAFRARGARVQYVYDWQDAFANCAVSGSPGSDTPIQNFPTTLSFLVYPAGTWIRALNDVITLNSVYDSTKLATNQVTHLFTETGWKMMRMCPISRVYTVAICPSGKTTSQGTLTCP